MVSLFVVFWTFVILFAIIGAMRGWAKEILVTASVILALFIITVLQTYIGAVVRALGGAGGTPLFWMRIMIILLLAFFGYQTPNIRGIAGARFARERLSDVLLGLFIGALNGYLIVGSIWYYLNAAGYPFKFILPPQQGFPYYQQTISMLNYLPPAWLTIPWIYFAVALAFLFVIIVFI